MARTEQTLATTATAEETLTDALPYLEKQYSVSNRYHTIS
jgi:hypothetical protein